MKETIISKNMEKVARKHWVCHFGCDGHSCVDDEYKTTQLLEKVDVCGTAPWSREQFKSRRSLATPAGAKNSRTNDGYIRQDDESNQQKFRTDILTAMYANDVANAEQWLSRVDEEVRYERRSRT